MCERVVRFVPDRSTDTDIGLRQHYCFNYVLVFNRS